MNRTKQVGMHKLLLLLMILIFGTVLWSSIKVAPAYIDNMYIVEALRSLAEDHPDDLHELPKSEIRRKLSKFYTVNNVRGEAAKALSVERLKGKTLISISYETRVPLFYNIDAVLTFDNVLDSSKPDECCSAQE